MIFCTACGNQLPNGTKFCVGCGTPVAQDQENEPAAIQQQQIPQGAGFAQTISINKRLIRSFAAALVALIIATMLLGWINIRVGIEWQTTNDLADQLYQAVTQWIDAHVDLLDIEAALREIRDHAYVNERVDEFIEEIVYTIRQDFGYYIELHTDFRLADLLTNEDIRDLAAEAYEMLAEMIDELTRDTMLEVRSVLNGLSGLSFSASCSAYSLLYLAQLIDTVSEAVQLVMADSELAMPYMGDALLAANILRMAWAICVLLLVVFLFCMTAELKFSWMVGLIGTGFAFVLALAAAIGLNVGNSMLSDADVIGGLVQLGPTVWVYACLGFSFAAVVILVVKRKVFSSTNLML